MHFYHYYIYRSLCLSLPPLLFLSVLVLSTSLLSISSLRNIIFIPLSLYCLFFLSLLFFMPLFPFILPSSFVAAEIQLQQSPFFFHLTLLCYILCHLFFFYYLIFSYPSIFSFSFRCEHLYLPLISLQRHLSFRATLPQLRTVHMQTDSKQRIFICGLYEHLVLVIVT